MWFVKIYYFNKVIQKMHNNKPTLLSPRPPPIETPVGGMGGAAAFGFTSETGVDDMGAVGSGCTGGGVVGIAPAAPASAGGAGAGAASLAGAGVEGADGCASPAAEIFRQTYR